ncbi:N-6 DNA methylase [Streptomyces sp. NPDC126499]|uniref:N-6 DNA methylase n=1 Tax=Streptomyces sp. NPDC126499 TaxID=3155314 RepID=UPI00331ED039
MSTNTGPARVGVTLAEIARIAGVGRAAVSNWRRRYSNFPSPIGGTDTSPQFSLSEVEAWLERENKLNDKVNPLDRLWPEYEALGDREATGLLIAQVGLRLSGGQAVETERGPAVDQRQSQLMESTLELASRGDHQAVFQFLLERWLRTHVRQVATTPSQLADLMADIAAVLHRGEVRSVLDPACGAGTLLLAAGRQWGTRQRPLSRFLGQDIDRALTELTRARLAISGFSKAGLSNISSVAGDTLRADAHPDAQADVVLCDPPSNERDWGHAELATDVRWLYGQPPRTEPELAWVQHSVAALAPGGVAVLVLPPAVAARRAGRRIRAGLLRAGVLRAVIALPPGAAPPYGVGLHLWVLRAAGSTHDGPEQVQLTLVDAAHDSPVAAVERTGIDWSAVTTHVLDALSGRSTLASVSLPVVDLLDDQVDLTPARHIPRTHAATSTDLQRLWARFDAHARDMRHTAAALSDLDPSHHDRSVPLIGVGELERAGALQIRSGQGVPADLVRRGERRAGEVRVLAGTTSSGREPFWLPTSAVTAGERDGSLTVSATHDVIVSVLARAFDVRVESEAPSVLGPQLSALRVDPAILDPWFLAGCLRSPANVQQAGTHASTTSRIDVRRLQIPRLSLMEQKRYGEIYRRILAFESALADMRGVGAELSRSLGDLLAAGRLPRS